MRQHAELRGRTHTDAASLLFLEAGFIGNTFTEGQSVITPLLLGAAVPWSVGVESRDPVTSRRTAGTQPEHQREFGLEDLTATCT